jgi:23S rRNA (guanine745-N1)-methyltransferase
VLDAGCGTGYYLGVLKTRAAPQSCFLGTDVSKEAVRRAAREHPDMLFFLNDIKYRLSVESGSVDLLLNIFAPRNTQEFSRVLDEDGVLLVVIPTAQHLEELRSRFDLLEIGEEKKERTVEQLAPEFQLAAEEELSYQVDLQRGDAGDLLRMTPNYWHLDPGVMKEADAIDAMNVRLSFRILAFRKG